MTTMVPRQQALYHDVANVVELGVVIWLCERKVATPLFDVFEKG